MPTLVSRIIDCYVFRRTPAGVEFLLLKRQPAKRLGGTWQSVHGKIEPNETAWQAARRELAEETGLTPIGFWQIDFVNTFYIADRDEIHLCPSFAAEAAPSANVTLNHEHTEFRWEPFERALETLMWPGQRHALREIMEFIIAGSAAEPHLRIG